MSDKILRNVCLVMFVMESICTVRYAVDLALGGGTEWWKPVAAGVIAVVLFVLFDKYRKKAEMGRMQ